MILKIMSLFLSFVTMIMTFFGGNVAEKYSTVTPVSKTEGELTVDNDTNLYDTVKYAYSMKNTVQAVYANGKRTSYSMSNGIMTLTHNLNAGHLSTLKDANGNTYIENSFKTFYTDLYGTKHYFEDDVFTTARMNTIRNGEYYYDCHIRDLSFLNFKVDKNYHIYGDRQYYQYSLYSTKDTKAFKAFGSEIKIPVDDVADYKYDTENGYVAFVIKNVGVVGFIIPNDGSTKDLTVETKNGNYIITHTANCGEGGLKAYDSEWDGKTNPPYITFGARIYTDNTFNYDGIIKAAYEERTPLTDITVGENNADCKYVGYDSLRGAYTFTCNGTDFNISRRDASFEYYMPITIKGGNEDRNIYIRMNDANGCLESAAILDDSDKLASIDVEVCKNFQGDGGEDFYSYKDYQYGDSFIPFVAKAETSTKFTMLNLYQNWGKNPLKQLSSIEYFNTYYHLSTGTTESNCISPYYLYGKDGNLLPDFRTRSGNEWIGQPQYNSVGMLQFMVDNGNYSEFAGSIINSVGQTFADVTDSYTDNDNRYTYSLRHVEFPSTDENRTFYTLNVEFNEDVTFDNFKEDFSLFTFTGRFNVFDNMGYTAEDNKTKSVSAYTDGKEKYFTLGTEKPYYSLYGISADTQNEIEKGYGCNFALIINSSKITLNGVETNIPFCVRLNGTDEKSCADLTLNTDNVSFKKGDTIELNIILLPNGTGYETEDTHALNVRSENALSVTAQKGTVVDDCIIPTVKAVNNEAEFTVKGGKNNTAVCVTGITTSAKPVIYKQTDGEWVEFDNSYNEYNSDNGYKAETGYNGYSITTNDDGTYTISFVYNSDGSEATFKINY